MKYGMEKYKFYIHQEKDGSTKIVAVSTFGGRNVKGVAKCDPRDNCDIEKGKKLAALRCAQKIENKRLKQASRKYLEAGIAADKADAYFDKMKSYYMDTVDELDNIQNELTELMTELN